ncbi:hypothetical protein RYX36_027130, partial [Vicia faba]
KYEFTFTITFTIIILSNFSSSSTTSPLDPYLTQFNLDSLILRHRSVSNFDSAFFRSKGKEAPFQLLVILYVCLFFL